MGQRLSRVLVALFFAAGMGIGASSAHASFHFWKIDEVYSNASGTVQFIEFLQPGFGFDDERFLTEAPSVTDTALGHTFTYTADLPSAPPINSHFLMATPGYAALPGVPAADYVFPANNWFSTAGDTLTYAGGIDSVTFSAAQLPIGGVLSLNRAYGASTFTSSTNSPTDFAGNSGTVVLPEPSMRAMPAIGLAIGLLGARRLGRGHRRY